MELNTQDLAPTIIQLAYLTFAVIGTSSLHQGYAGNKARARNLCFLKHWLPVVSSSSFSYLLMLFNHCLSYLSSIPLTSAHLHCWWITEQPTAFSPSNYHRCTIFAFPLNLAVILLPTSQWAAAAVKPFFIFYFFCLDHTTHRNSCNNNRQDKDLMNWYCQCSVFWWLMFNVTIPLRTGEFPCYVFGEA